MELSPMKWDVVILSINSSAKIRKSFEIFAQLRKNIYLCAINLKQRTMKKCVFFAAMLCVLTACEKEIDVDNAATSEKTVVDRKKFTFTVKGDFLNEWKSVTRGYMSADGKDMTDLWVLDYVSNELVQQLHQSDNTAEDFGKPVMNLSYGTHHVYFVASRGTSPVLDTTNGTITWQTVRDTFWKDYEVSVVSTSNGNRAVTLDRIVTKLSLAFTDAISTNAKTINFTPATWYYGMNYKTGEPTTATSLQTSTMTLPDEYAGRTDVSVSYFSISPSTEWSTDVTVNSKDNDGNIIGQGVMTAVPLKRNRVTEYSGPLFSSGGAVTLSLNSTWDTSVSGTW